MGTPPGRYPPAETPPGYGGEPDPASVPATTEDVRNLRRWLWVAAIWAVAASAIALIALIDDDTGGSERGSRGASTTQVERLSDRLDELEDDVKNATGDSDVSAIQTTVDDLEGEVEELKQQSDTVKGLQENITTFEDKLRELENRIIAVESPSSPDDGQQQP